MDYFLSNQVGCQSWEIGGLCSGHGTCRNTITQMIVREPNIPDTYCDCDSGWTDQGLFIRPNGQDCGINIIGVNILFGLLLLASLNTIYVGCRFLYRFKQEELTHLTWQENFTTFIRCIRSYPLLPGFSLTIILALDMVVHCILQFRGIYIGQTPYNTIFFSLQTLGMAFTQWRYNHTFLQLNLALISLSDEEKTLLSNRKGQRVFNIFYVCLHLLQASISFSTSFITSIYAGNLAVFFWCFFLGCVATATNIWAFILLDSAIKMISNHKESDFFKQEQRFEAISKLKIIRKQVKFNPIVVSIFFVACFWPWLRNHVIWYAPLLYTLAFSTYAKAISPFRKSWKSMDSESRLSVFARIVGDPAGYQALADFLGKEHSSENLYFWRDVEYYRSLFSTTTGQPEILDQAKQIYVKYIGGELINIPFDTRNSLVEWYHSLENDDETTRLQACNSDTLRTLFNDAQHEIYSLLVADSLLRFEKTPEFAAIQEKWAADKFVGLVIPGGSSHKDSRPLPPTPHVEIESSFEIPSPSSPSAKFDIELAECQRSDSDFSVIM